MRAHSVFFLHNSSGYFDLFLFHHFHSIFVLITNKKKQTKEKEKLKCENYELKMKLYELQRKFNRNSTGAEKSSLNFEYNESKVFEPNSQILDAHKRMIDFNLSHTVSDDHHESINRELYQQLLAEKVQAEEQVREYQAKVVELESTAENIQNEANLINQKYLYAEKYFFSLFALLFQKF